ncbi:hypothetical protein Slin14017_G102610 [Septoria linicola]|nr:hypothetical protein Slin14017_G102610 [Septoria linicola]
MSTTTATVALPAGWLPVVNAGVNGTIQNIVWQGMTVPAYGTLDSTDSVFEVHHIAADTDFEIGVPDGVILGDLNKIKGNELLQLLSKESQPAVHAKMVAAHGNSAIAANTLQARVRAAFQGFEHTVGVSAADAKALFNDACRKNGRPAPGSQRTQITWTNEGRH